MSDQPEIHTITDDLYVAVARTRDQFEALLSNVGGTFYGKIAGFKKAFPHAAKDIQDQKSMGMFIIGKNGIYIDGPGGLYDPKNRVFLLQYSQISSSKEERGAFVLLPFDQRPIMVDAEGTQVIEMRGGPRDLAALCSMMGSGRADDIPEGILERLGIADLFGALSRRVTQHKDQNKPRDFWDKKMARNIVQLSQYVKDSHPNTYFAGIGNSPSYIVYTIGQLGQKQGEHVDTQFVPFSSRFVRPRFSETWDALEQGALVYDVGSCNSNYTKDYKGSNLNRQEYRNFLTTLDMDPKAIIYRFDQFHEQTMLIDNVQRGTSFASFIYFMHDWAKDLRVKGALSQSLTYLALSDEPIPSKIVIPGVNLSVDIEILPIPTKMRYALNSNMSLETDRFVPHYPPRAWGSPPPRTDQNNEKVAEVKSLIRDAVNDHFGPNSDAARSRAKPPLQPYRDVP